MASREVAAPIGVELAMWTVGVGLLTGFGKAPWRLALNVPVIAILVSLALHYLGAGPHVPEVVHTVTGAMPVPSRSATFVASAPPA